MTKQELINALNGDLRREYAHWHYYMAAAERVRGPHREEFQEFFMKEAAGEMQHILEFGKMIRGLGGVPTHETVDYEGYFNHYDCPDNLQNILRGAWEMEQNVVAWFVQRMDQCDVLEENGGQDKIDARFVHIFLEDQMVDSRNTVDHIAQMLN